MHYPIPNNPQEILALRQHQVDEELVATAIAGVIRHARSQGKSLEDLTAEVMADDSVLDYEVRLQLSEIVGLAWRSLF